MPSLRTATRRGEPPARLAAARDGRAATAAAKATDASALMGVVWPKRRPQAKQKLVSSGLRLPQPEQMSADPAPEALAMGVPQRWQKAEPSATTPPH